MARYEADRRAAAVDAQARGLAETWRGLSAVRRVHTGARVYGSSRTIGGSIIVGTCSGLVFEMGAKDLAPQASLQVNDAVTNAVAISPDERTIFVPTYMNEVHAFTRTLLD